MSAAGAAPALPVSADAGGLRLRAYTLCLLVAFAAYALVFAWSAGLVFALACVAVFALLGAALVLPSFGQRRLRAGMLGATLAGAAALLVPLAGRIAAGETLPAAVRETTVWPQMLVLLFAGRVLAETCEARFALFWRDPFRGGHAATQSLPAAFFVGAALTLLFYQFTGGIAVAPDRVDPAAIVLRAFTGQTAIHAAIILLFFTVLAGVADAALLSLNDGAALGLLRRLLREAPAASLTRAEIARRAGIDLSAFAHTRTMQWVRDAAGQGTAAASTLDGFHAASRRLLRALLSFLPLLGFLGTVIGLTAAIGGLPGGIGPAAQGDIDISASLLGLAVKFETTLLGLLGGLVGTFLLTLLDKREGELAAACRHLVETAARRD